MITFLFLILLSVACGVVAFMMKRGTHPLWKGALAASFLWGGIALIQSSCIWVTSGKFATMKRVYGATSLAPGHVVAANGELGPQAEIIMPGFHFRPFVRLANDLEHHEVTYIEPGSCALVTAKDGASLPSGANFADPWPVGKEDSMANDAVFFLKNGGQRGPQTTVLRTGSYTLNPYLWQVKVIPVTRVEQGTVGVVKASVHAAVNFGAFVKDKPSSNELRVMKGKIPTGAAEAALVPVGAVGIWEEPLLPGIYNINTDAYKVTPFPVTTEVFDHKGGYSKKVVEVWIDDEAKIQEKEKAEEQVPVADNAEPAINTTPEGWTVPQEVRIQAQVTPEWAPFVVASLRIVQSDAREVIEQRVITPIMRSVVRAVIGGENIEIRSSHPVYKPAAPGVEPEPELDPTGQPKMKELLEFRPVKVMDLLNNRAQIEAAIEKRARPEALKFGVTIEEVRLGESAIPGALLVARKRQQLAEQMTLALKQEEEAQTQRQSTEKARAIAGQQATLAAAEMKQQAAEKLKEATITAAEGEAKAILAVAEAQKAQTEVLGKDGTLQLRQFELGLKSFELLVKENPQIVQAAVSNPGKWVPSIVVGGSEAGLSGPAAIFGHLMSGGGLKDNSVPPKPATAQ